MSRRAAWSVVISLALAAVALLLQHKWRHHLTMGATVTSLDTATLPIYQLPFPAVSVCPINKVHRSHARSLLQNMYLPEGMSLDQGVQELGKLVELIEPREKDIDHLRLAQAILDLNNVSLDVFMRKISPSCDSMLPTCKWKGRTQRCSEIFVLRKTFEGYCCSFNYLGVLDEIVSYERQLNVGSPRRISSAGHQMGLSVVVSDVQDEYVSTLHVSHGVKRYLGCRQRYSLPSPVNPYGRMGNVSTSSMSTSGPGPGGGSAPQLVAEVSEMSLVWTAAASAQVAVMETSHMSWQGPSCIR
ncbi:sodium channel protein Nach-like [Schistocerca americana]|uniref:sodium channel protein Nach-like n=1 Tax=Schistocerca americana TaxID=7009 RepID=UPI001F4F1467|nr:sodium channel protein Nach-like [Schistocerca americana]